MKHDNLGNSLSYWSRGAYAGSLLYANRKQKERRAGAIVCGAIGILIAGFFIFLGIIKFFEIIWTATGR